MTYSYTQISQYLTCPRRYRHRYLDGWQEKDTRAAMLFGRAFEQALAAYFRREDAPATLYREWAVYKNQPLHYSEGDSWDRMLQQGLQLLDRFCQDGRVRIRHPRRNLQIQFSRPFPGGNDFVAYVFFFKQKTAYELPTATASPTNGACKCPTPTCLRATPC